MGLSSALARANAASPHSYQSIGWRDAERRYGLAASFRRFSVEAKRFLWKGVEWFFDLLNYIARAKITRVERLATCEPFILAMIEADAILAELPTQVNILIVDNGREIEEADV